ncbi:MAG TPA: hypothetical protein VHR46_05750 [Gaiella sp.]|nr:hypothetical protein [Gaiella sp.]
MGALPRLIAHHASGAGLVIEGLVLAALVIFFGWIWLRERRRRLGATRRVPEMRE